MAKKTILLLTDFYYEAKGREYFREDIALSGLLRKNFNLCISHIDDADQLLKSVDLVLIRNTGPRGRHQEQLNALRARSDLKLFNDLAGKGDIQGKQHLIDLFKLGFPVIPTYVSSEELTNETNEKYLLKPYDGADSQGVKILTRKELLMTSHPGFLIQPLVEFQYEVSFYFIGSQFQYALYAPDPQKRWELKPYIATQDDLNFALKFIHWNTCRFGIQRVDACRVQDGSLLLMELEDYNPFLSLDLLEPRTKEQFIEALCSSLEECIYTE